MSYDYTNELSITEFFSDRNNGYEYNEAPDLQRYRMVFCRGNTWIEKLYTPGGWQKMPALYNFIAEYAIAESGYDR